jgi:hypothetical protein
VHMQRACGRLVDLGTPGMGVPRNRVGWSVQRLVGRARVPRFDHRRARLYGQQDCGRAPSGGRAGSYPVWWMVWQQGRLW